MSQSNLSLRALELFEITARTGSVQATAEETGMSVSSVSHHLKQLETRLGVALVDHARRPMPLTPAGRNFHRRVQAGLREIRLAEREATIGGLSEGRDLRLGLVEDFESAVAPELAVSLAANLPGLRLRMTTQPSHEALESLRRRKLDLAVAASPGGPEDGLVELPLLRDPYVLAAPRDRAETPEAFLAGETDLPFLRYSPDHYIGRQIDAQLARAKARPGDRFAIDSNQTIMGLIASGHGWAITTPVGYLRAARFMDRITLHQAPLPAFARRISLFTATEGRTPTVDAIDDILRRLVGREAVAPALERFPWLAGELALLN